MEFEEFKIMYQAEDTHWWYRGLRGVMFRLLGLRNPRRRCMQILDAGCGTGGTLQALQDAGFTRTEGFDLSKVALEFCNMRGLNGMKRGSITDIPFGDCSFDVVISCDVLNDVGTPNEQKALTELYRVLKPRGYLFDQIRCPAPLPPESPRGSSPGGGFPFLCFAPGFETPSVFGFVGRGGLDGLGAVLASRAGNRRAPC